MAHRFLIKDIALQAGLGMATVDRVLNRRGNVRQQTIDRVQQAIVALEEQRQQLAMTGRKILVDLVVEAPLTFIEALEDACRIELPLMRPAIIRIRSDPRAGFREDDRMKNGFNHFLNNFGLFFTSYISLSVMIYAIERLA